MSGYDPPPPPPPPPAGGAGGAGLEGRRHRPRRSALRQPVLVDRSDLPDDAEGRVEILTIAAPGGEPAAVEPSREPRGGGAGALLAGLADSGLAPAALAIVLLNVFWIGLVFTH